jgi:hypothetical protein
MYNLLAAPALLFVSREYLRNLREEEKERVKDTLHVGRRTDLNVWLIPSVRFALWLLSQSFLTALLTLSSLDMELRWTDCLMLAYAASIVEAETCELRSEGARAYLRDIFNKLDILLFALITTLQAAHIAAIHRGLPELHRDVSVPLQALAALAAWLRLLECMYVFPNAGPQLLMTLQMLGDLGQMLLLLSFILAAFSSAFAVLLSDQQSGHAPGSTDFFAWKQRNSFWGALKAASYSALDAEPASIVDRFDDFDDRAGWAGFILVTLFGLLVVTLLLNLLIAVFAKSVDRVSTQSPRATAPHGALPSPLPHARSRPPPSSLPHARSRPPPPASAAQVTMDLDAHFKLKFGQVVMKVQRMGVEPQPFNLVRRAALLVQDCAKPVVRLLPCARVDTARRSKSAAEQPRPAAKSVRQSARRQSSIKDTLKKGAAVIAAWQQRSQADELAKKTPDQKASAFVERAVSTQVQLYPEEIVSFDAAIAQRSDGQLYRDSLKNTMNEVSEGMAALSRSVEELRAQQTAMKAELVAAIHHALPKGPTDSRIQSPRIQAPRLEAMSSACTPFSPVQSRGDSQKNTPRLPRKLPPETKDDAA